MARIRTVKPDFWSHPVMARQDDAVRLCALAVLNMADDEGYLYADPAAVRSFAWPFVERSESVRGTLLRLSEVGWLELQEHPTLGQIARVVNFAKHQRIDKPSPSKIKTYWFQERSRNDPGTILSGREGKGREQGGEGRCPLPPGEKGLCERDSRTAAGSGAAGYGIGGRGVGQGVPRARLQPIPQRGA